MARLDKVASRYAKAIFDSHQNGTKDALKKVIDELSRFASVVDENRELQQVFSSELFSVQERRAVVGDIATKVKVSPPATRILLVLAEMKRLAAVSAIVEKLRLLMLESADVVPLTVEAAAPLTPEQKEKIEGRFSKLLGKKVEASYIADPSLIGGLRVTAQGRTFDGSLAGWLSNFEQQLAEATAH